MKKPKTFHSKLETLRYETIPITFHLNFVGEKLYTILSVSVLSVSVSADMKIIISVFYRYRPIKKKAYRSYTEYFKMQLETHKLYFLSQVCASTGSPKSHINITTCFLDPVQESLLICPPNVWLHYTTA